MTGEQKRLREAFEAGAWFAYKRNGGTIEAGMEQAFAEFATTAGATHAADGLSLDERRRHARLSGSPVESGTAAEPFVRCGFVGVHGYNCVSERGHKGLHTWGAGAEIKRAAHTNHHRHADAGGV